jgi:hypothetical protein
VNQAFSKEVVEIKTLSIAINKLPPNKIVTSLQNWTDEQKLWWQHHKNYWSWIAKKIDYLQYKDLGYILPDPVASSSLHPGLRTLLEIQSNTFLAELQLMIAGWELIKSTAIRNQRNFIFNSPRELFVEYCKHQATLKTQFFLPTESDQGQTLAEVTDINQGQTLAEVRENYRRVTAFYRRRLEKEDEQYKLKECFECGEWLSFVIYAIWEHCLDRKFSDGKLSKAWGNYLNAFKTESAMFCKKDFFKRHGCKISLMKWSQGKAVYNDTYRPIVWHP